MKQETLIYNPKTAHYDVRFNLTDYHRSLHCGTGMNIMIEENRYIPKLNLAKIGI